MAEARRAVHEALVLLPTGEADRVRALVDLETAVESRAAMRIEPDTHRAALSGHPLLTETNVLGHRSS